MFNYVHTLFTTCPCKKLCRKLSPPPTATSHACSPMAPNLPIACANYTIAENLSHLFIFRPSRHSRFPVVVFVVESLVIPSHLMATVKAEKEGKGDPFLKARTRGRTRTQRKHNSPLPHPSWKRRRTYSVVHAVCVVVEKLRARVV